MNLSSLLPRAFALVFAAVMLKLYEQAGRDVHITEFDIQFGPKPASSRQIEMRRILASNNRCIAGGSIRRSLLRDFTSLSRAAVAWT